MRESIRFLAATLALAAATAAAQTQPATADRVAITEHDVIGMLTSFNERFVVEAYKAGGRRDARWDADALAFLVAQARDGVSEGSDTWYRPDERTPLADRVATGRRARDAGCDDAIVLYHLGVALEQAGDAREAAGTYAAANAAAERGSPYLTLFQLLILQADWRTNKYDDDTKRRPRYEMLLRDSLKDRTVLPEHRRAVWNIGTAVYGDDDARRQMMMGDAIAGMADADPWLFNLVMGRVAIKRAWDARGGGFAGTVTEDGWKGFSQHLTAARKHFELAVAADDAHPQPFANMITVAMAESAEHARPWFEHAIARQSDLSAAWGNYVYSLLPRWNGTHVEMFEAGIAQVELGRFDTRAPSWLLDAIARIERDQERPLDTRQLHRVYPHVTRCLDGYIANNARPGVQGWARSARAAWAARLEKWDEAQAQFDALRAAKLAPWDGPFRDNNLDAADVAARAAMNAGPLAAEVRAAGDDLAKLDALIAGLAPDAPAAEALRERRSTAAFAARMRGGEWTAVPLDLAADWRPAAGTWSAQGDALVGQPDDAGRLSIVSRFTLPARYEVRCVAGATEAKTGQADVGIAWAVDRPVIAMVAMSAGQGFLTRQYNYGAFPLTRDADGAAVVHARVDGGTVTILGPAGESLAEKDFGQLPAGARLAFEFPRQMPQQAAWRFAKIEVRAIE